MRRVMGGLLCFVLTVGLLAACDAPPTEYVGELKDGKREGQGRLTWSDGKTYIGQFKDGKPDGQGTFTFADGHKYVADLKDGRFSPEVIGNRISISSLNLLVMEPL